jgi:hypothetical protein
MIRFLDGPAKEAKLTLRRTPVYLRVVCDPNEKWDALDQLTDTPASNEKLFAYKIVSHDGAAFVDGRDSKTGKRFGYCAQLASYSVVADQPDEATMRDAAKWRAWIEKRESVSLNADGTPIKPEAAS